MNDFIYNPVLRQTRFDILLDRLSDTFYGSFAGYFLIQLAAFLLIAVSVVGVLTVGAALLA